MTTARRQGIWTVIFCGMLCAGFTATAWTAVSGKSATADEPAHAQTGWFNLWRHDYRLWMNNPPLWEYWVALPAPSGAIEFDPSSNQYRDIRPGPFARFWTRIDLPRLLERGRIMCLILGVALAALVGRWAWELGGNVPAVAATFLFCLDPNFLGHAPLVKNDVGLAAFYLATAYALWRAGRQLTWANAALLAVLTGVTMEVKFSAPLLYAVLALALLYRSMSGEPWLVLGRWVQTRGLKSAVAAGLLLFTAAVTYAVMWASYGFRFDAGPDGLQESMTPLVRSLGVFQLNQQLHRNPTNAELEAWRMPLLTQAMVFAEKHHLVPQAWAEGIVYTQLGDQGEFDGYLCGDSYKGGRWYYFPLAAAFKEPLATLAISMIALGVGIRSLRRVRASSAAARWSAAALAIPAGVYAIAIMTAQINIGFRHALPIHPFVFIAVGLAVDRLWKTRAGRLLVLLLGMGLFAETAAAFPNYIAFFNVACSDNKPWFLGDSNLDWGQDLPLLAKWQNQHPDIPLYLDYFGAGDPIDYRIRFVDVSAAVPPPQSMPGVVAISANYLQLNRYNAAALDALGVSPDQPPDQILGGTIYLFRTNPAGR